MDVIVIGVYTYESKKNIDNIVSQIENIEIVWDFDASNIVSGKGVNTFCDIRQIKYKGILKEVDSSSFSSYSLIYEITEYYIGEKTELPTFFNFINLAINTKCKDFVLIFADEWNEYIKLEKISIQKLIARLNNLYVWCDAITSLPNFVDERDDSFPLILEVEGGSV